MEIITTAQQCLGVFPYRDDEGRPFTRGDGSPVEYVQLQDPETGEIRRWTIAPGVDGARDTLADGFGRLFTIRARARLVEKTVYTRGGADYVQRREKIEVIGAQPVEQGKARG